eukprot:364215-Chlamydomonas_euryale.AAC.17
MCRDDATTRWQRDPPGHLGAIAARRARRAACCAGQSLDRVSETLTRRCSGARCSRATWCRRISAGEADAGMHGW